MPRRLIAHLDMDAFFASVELLRYPELRGQPVVVGGGRTAQPHVDHHGVRQFKRLSSYAGRGVVTTCTYEARTFGIHSAMGMMKAARLAPDAFILPSDFEEYRRYSRLFKTAVMEIAPVVEDRGIDEIYIDLSEVPGAQDEHDGDPLGGARRLAARLKAAVHEATGLTCSISVTPNKLLAKLCSELDKPDGLTIVTMEDVPTRVWPLAARKLNGIGPKSAEKLSGLGLHTIGDIAAADMQWLIAQFGETYGTWLHEACNGRDDRPVVTWRAPKSVSRETTFEQDLHAVRDRQRLSEIFTALCTKLADDLVRKGYVSRQIGLKLRYDDFHTVTRDVTLPAYIQDGPAIRHAAGQLLKRVPLERRIRLLGVRAGSLARPEDVAKGAERASPMPKDRRLLGTLSREDRQIELPLFGDPEPIASSQSLKNPHENGGR